MHKNYYMSQKSQLEKFRESNHYKDICYLIDHIANQDVLNSCAEELGYSVGIDIFSKEVKPMVKQILVGKNKEFRVVTLLRKGSQIAETIVFKF